MPVNLNVCRIGRRTDFGLLIQQDKGLDTGGFRRGRNEIRKWVEETFGEAHAVCWNIGGEPARKEESYG